MISLKKLIFWGVTSTILILIVVISLIINAQYVLALLLLVVYGIFFWKMVLVTLIALGGDWGCVDLSLVSKRWITIPNTRHKNPNAILHLALYESKIKELQEKRPYMILSHGMAGTLHDLELMSVPLAISGYHVVAYNQCGHGRLAHRSTGSGKDYTEVMVNIHDVVDFVLQQENLAFDENNQPRIGFIGASTGGLIALTQAYLNPSIKITVALSGIHDFRELLLHEKEYPFWSLSRMFLWMLRKMKVKTNYTDEENKIISPKHCLKPDPSNKSRVFMVHCADDPLPISEAKLNQQAAALPDSNCLFLQRGGHNFRSQETILASVVQSWISKYL
jgi:Serine aminopeptidase, S33